MKPPARRCDLPTPPEPVAAALGRGWSRARLVDCWTRPRRQLGGRSLRQCRWTAVTVLALAFVAGGFLQLALDEHRASVVHLDEAP